MADETIRFFEGPLRALLITPTGPVGRDLARRAIRVESAAKGRCPVDTGRLRSSIRFSVAASDSLLGGEFVVSVRIATNSGAVATIGSDVEYAGYIEQGTSRMAARPYLVPALAAAYP